MPACLVCRDVCVLCSCTNRWNCFSVGGTFDRYNHPSYPSGPTIGGYLDTDTRTRGTIFLVGNNFFSESTTANARLSQTGCEATNWRSSTLLRCRPGAGTAATHSVIVTSAGGRYGSRSEGISFDVPDISEVINWNGPAVAASTELLTLSGMNFGVFSTSVASRIGATHSENTVWTSMSALTALLVNGLVAPYDNSATANYIAVSVGERVGCSIDSFSYDKLRLRGFGPAEIATANAVTTGSISVSIFGKNFASWDASMPVRCAAMVLLALSRSLDESQQSLCKVSPLSDCCWQARTYRMRDDSVAIRLLIDVFDIIRVGFCGRCASCRDNRSTAKFFVTDLHIQFCVAFNRFFREHSHSYPQVDYHRVWVLLREN